MEIDIRLGKQDEIQKIIYAGDGFNVDYSYVIDNDTINNIVVTDEDGGSINVSKAGDLDNLIKALQRARQLWT